MFGPGLAEYLTLLVDPLIAAVMLRRWGFRMLPTAVAWIACTVLAITAAGVAIARCS